jgi:hypothetical protein
VLILGDAGPSDFDKSGKLAFSTLVERGLTKSAITFVGPTDLDLDGDKIAEPRWPATLAGLSDAFKEARSQATKDSKVIVVIQAHGRSLGTDFEFGLKLGDPIFGFRKVHLTASTLEKNYLKVFFEGFQQLLVIDSCFSGSAIEPLKDNHRWIVTSTDAQHSSWNHISIPLGTLQNQDESDNKSLGYSLFSFDFFNALRPSDPLKAQTPFDKDDSKDLSVEEAFAFVKSRKQELKVTATYVPARPPRRFSARNLDFYDDDPSDTLTQMQQAFAGMCVTRSSDGTQCFASLKNFPQAHLPTLDVATK